MNKRTFHPRINSKLDHRIEQAGEGFNQACIVALWLGFFVILFMCNAPVKQHYTTGSHSKEHEVSENDYLFAVADSHKGGNMSEGDMQVSNRQMAMETRQQDVDAMKPKARAVYYASLQGNEFSVVDK